MDEKNQDIEFPKTFQEFGYMFNPYGQLQHIVTGAPFNFNERENDHIYNQKRYEALGELVTDYVYGLMTDLGLKRLALPLDASMNEPTTVIFHTKDAFTNEKVIILIHGSGVVRAGQWARRLIINDSIKSGTQMPFIKRAIGLNYGVFVLNTNDNSREINNETYRIRGSETPENHANYVWSKLIMSRAVAKHVAIIAHSYGGIVAVNLCKTFPDSFQRKVVAIAFTDSPHSLVSQKIPIETIAWFRQVSRNWVSSNTPLDTPLDLRDPNEVECYSAGTQRHDLTSWMSFASIFEYVDRKLHNALLTKALFAL